MKFPASRTSDAEAYVTGYIAAVDAAYASIDRGGVAKAAVLITEAIAANRMIYSCGNGGSAAIANHLCCDFAKGIATGTGLRPRIVSLSSTVELITAIGNDCEFADIFVHQLQAIARPGDLLIAVSSSGNSENIIRAADWALRNDVRVIGLSGFSGGRLRERAHVPIHADAENYGVIEDVHQSVMHMLAQFIRQSALDGPAVAAAVF